MLDHTERHKLLSSSTDSKQCKLSELVQYQCEVGSTHIECNPFVRLFLSCSGKPMMEVTPVYSENGDSIKTRRTKLLPGFTMMEET
ncbi:hypothetical protein BC941DRAFT_518397 [Chlamydoabsidia padenii]|nr:hypothetical protein BC941DRAFT_518397 [Chlamydoabsidia padenii]